jgi:O-antigen ligase
MGHPNFVAGYILLVLPLTIARAIATKSWQRIGSLAASLLMLLTLYTTSSRGGFLGAAIAMIVAVGFAIVKSKGKKRWISLAVCLLGLILAATVAVQNPRVRQIVKIGSQTSNSQAIELKVDGESRDRLLMLQATLNILKDRPLFGVGAGNMSRVYGLYRPIETGTGAELTQQLHNTPAQIIGELGLFGLSVYLIAIGCFYYLWGKLDHKIINPQDRSLLYGVGSGLLAYVFSSLTDYQLENISIASNLVLPIVLLIGLADTCQLSAIDSINNHLRRWISLGTVTCLFLALLLWMPVAYAMQLCSAADNNFKAGKLDEGYAKLSLAANLVSYDPIYSALAGFTTLKIRNGVRDSQLFNELTELSFKHFQQTVKAAPNDSSFNQMLGMLYRDRNDSQSAALSFSKAIQLLPRSERYTYYLLGREYLKQGKTDEAIAAFAVQALILPKFLTSPLWFQSPFAEIKEPVLKETFSLLSQLLEEISIDSPDYKTAYEELALLRWWHKYPIENFDLKKLRLELQAFLLAETEPQLALQLLDKAPTNSNLQLLLRVWLQPKHYLQAYLDSKSGKLLNETDRQYVERSVYQHRDFRNWLASINQVSTSHSRLGLAHVYRNLQVGNIAYVLTPQEVQTSKIVDLLDLFPKFSRENIYLEATLDRIIKEKLKVN